MKDQLFFFFGSLREGYWNQRVIQDLSMKVGVARTVEPTALYIDEHGTVPTCVPGEGNCTLKGDVYHLTEQDAARVHSLESGYKFKKVKARLEDGSIVEVLIYYHDKASDCPYIRKPVLVPNGDYTTVVGKDSRRL